MLRSGGAFLFGSALIGCEMRRLLVTSLSIAIAAVMFPRFSIFSGAS
jgi:hypothetical protein